MALPPGNLEWVTEDGIPLSSFMSVARGQARVEINDACMQRVRLSAATLNAALQSGQIIYGVNTGFGKLSNTVLPASETAALQRNLVRSHACGVGHAFSSEIVRSMMLLRIVSLTRGFSGVRPELVHLLRDCLNTGIHPVVPEQGSLGASGDLAPLAHLALVLIGEGEAFHQGQRLPGYKALSNAGLQPIELQAKEGLALINGTQAMVAVGIDALWRSMKIADAADLTAALTLEALGGIVDAFLPCIQAVRPYPEQAAVAERIRYYLNGSGYVSAPTPQKVQDAYSLRCIPQVHGASRRALAHIQSTLAIEMNAVTDNPLVFSDSGRVISGGNFHGQPIALAMDYLKIAVAELADISERRTERLVNPQLSGLPAFLTPNPGLTSGLMILQYTAAALVSENKVLAHPASVDSIPSSANQEDHVSMGSIAARQACQIVDNVARVIAIELICATQALTCKDGSCLSPITRNAAEWVNDVVPPYRGDRSYSRDIEVLAEKLENGQFVSGVLSGLDETEGVNTS